MLGSVRGALSNERPYRDLSGLTASSLKEQRMSDEKPMGQVIQIDEARIRDHLGEMVRGTVEETLNAMLDGGAGRYERSQAWQDTRARSYDRDAAAPARSISRSRSYGARPSRRQSSNVIAGARARSRCRGIPDRDVPELRCAEWRISVPQTEAVA
jgi:hypothetical protein